MGKKSKKRKKRLKYNKNQFANILCSGCSICSNYSTGPSFCYDLYKDDPRLFLDNIYKKLTNISQWPCSIDQPCTLTGGVTVVSDETVELTVFRNIFCLSGVCFDTIRGTFGEGFNGYECPSLPQCMNAMRTQIAFTGTTSTPFDEGRYRKEKGRKKKKQKYICTPYPTFFSSERKEWVEEIQSILGHDNGDNNSEQDKGEKGT